MGGVTPKILLLETADHGDIMTLKKYDQFVFCMIGGKLYEYCYRRCR